MARRRKPRVAKKLAKQQNNASNSSTVRPFYSDTKGGTYHGANSKRDVWEVGGLPDQISFNQLFNVFRRNGLAHAGVMKPVERCWRSKPIISDGELADGEDFESREKTAFERDLQVLIDKHHLFERLIGLDYRQRVGRYGGIVIVAKESADDNPAADKPLKALGINSLIKLMPVFESQIVVTDDNDDITSPDFGNPKFYDFRSNAVGSRTTTATQLSLDPSRVFAFGEGADDGTIYGKSSLESPFNALLDWEKIRVSAAEGFYKNAKQRIALNINNEQTAGTFLNEQNRAIFDKNVDDFGKGWDSSLLLSGMDVNAIQSAITDPTGPANMCLQEIVSGFNIPKTILIGFETGERSSTENSEVFNEDMMSRRENTLTNMIKSLLMHLVEVGVMSAPTKEISVAWDDLLASSDDEKLEKASKMATINQTSYAGGGGQVFTESEIREAAEYDIESEENFDLEGELEKIMGGEKDGITN